MKVRLPIVLAVALLCLATSLVWLPAFRGVSGINGFSPNQELPLPLLAPVPTSLSPAAFVVRGLEPSVRTDAQGTIYVSSIRGVPGGVDLHRWYSPVDGGANPDGTLPFKYEGQPDISNNVGPVKSFLSALSPSLRRVVFLVLL